MAVRNDSSTTTMPAAGGSVSPGAKVVGVLVASWCVGFAAVNAWHLATGLPEAEYPGYTTALTVMSVIVLGVKLLGAGVALASLRPAATRRRQWLLGAALWGATITLALYSAGSLVITVGTVSGLTSPSAAWQAAGGVTLRAIAYVMFFLVGTAMFGVLAVAFERRHGRRRTAVAAGAIGGPVLLGGLLVVVPAVLQAAELMPSA